MDTPLKELMEKFNINNDKPILKSKNKGNGAGRKNTNDTKIFYRCN